MSPSCHRRKRFVTTAVLPPLSALLLGFTAFTPAQSVAQTAEPAKARPEAAQDTAAKSPATDQALVAPGLALAEDALRARLERVKSATGLGPGARARAVASYETAIADLATAGSLARKAEAFEQARSEAPRMLTELEREKARSEPPPKLPKQSSADELKGLLHDFENELASARTMVAKIEGEQSKRARRRLESPRQVAAATNEVAEIEAKLRVADTPAEGDEVALAERAAQLARRELLLATLAFNEKEIEAYDARRDVLAAKRDQAIRRIARLSETVRELRGLVGSTERTAAERDVKRAREAAREAAKVHPALRVLAHRNTELAALRSGPNGLAMRIEEARAAIADAEAKVAHVTQRYDRAREKAEAVGFTPAIGSLLRKERAELPDQAEQQRAIRERQSEVGAIQLRLIELEDARDEIADVDIALGRLMAKVERGVDSRERRAIESTARELLLTQSGYLDSLVEDHDAYFTSLIELDATQRDLVTAVRRYADYIDENVLWIRGPSIVSQRMLEGLQSTFAWLARPANGARLVEGVRTTLAVRPLTTVLAVLSWAVLFVYRRRMQSLLDVLCTTRAKAMSMTLADTLRALLLTAALAALWPAFLVLIAYLLAGVEGASGDFGGGIGAGLMATAKVFFVAEFLRRLCKPGGPGEIHLGWSAKATAAARRALAGAMAVGLPAMFIVTTLDAQSKDLFKISVGRFAFVAGMLSVAVAIHRLLRPGGGVLDDGARPSYGGWTAYLPRVVRLAATAVPLFLVVMAAAGYDFAALSVTRKVAQTSSVALVLFLVNALVVRWLVLARRRMALRQAWDAEAARQQAEKRAPADGEAAGIADAVDIGAVSTQTRRLVRTFLGASLVVAIWLIWHDVMPALRVFEHVELWQVTETVTETVQTDEGEEQRILPRQRPVTVADLLAAIFIALLALVAGRNIPGLLEFTLLQQLRVNAGLRYAITSISRYLIAVIGTVLVVSTLGVSWSKVQWLVAAMTVGLGFGLQEIFANFISGLIILFERPIRVGDVVTLGGVTGTVARIRIRATTIVDGDRKELIVPNKEFITGKLVNWTLSDQTLRVVIHIGIAYGSDTERVEQLLLEIANQCEHSHPDIAPSVSFASFGENALEFELSVFVARIDHFGRTKHALAMAIDKAFRKEGIELAFPQRDLHIRSVSAAIPVTLQREGSSREAEIQQTGTVPLRRG